MARFVVLHTEFEAVRINIDHIVIYAADTGDTRITLVSGDDVWVTETPEAVALAITKALWGPRYATVEVHPDRMAQ